MNETKGFQDTIPVRSGEMLEVERLTAFLEQQFDVGKEPLEINQFGSGHSNLTYELKIGEWKSVLRRPPHGPVAPKAHDMEREFSILRDLHPVFPLAPKPYVFSEDTSIVGSPFYLMERKRGFVYDTSFPSDISVTSQLCRTLSETMVDTLVNLHSIDYKKTRLVEFTQPEGFMVRQVNGWIGRYSRSQTDEVKGLEELTKWLVSNIPTSQEPTIIHYDYKLNNSMFSFKDPTQMVGLFDWEMATVGDPLADVGAAMSYWIEKDDPQILKYGLGKPPVTINEGFFTRKEFVELYAKKSGRDLANIHFYITFAYFKLAVICQQIYYRFKQGQTNDPRFANFHLFVESLIEIALDNRKI
ncbi:phosphotransferase family protein [Bacillus sp. DJP31]|uniref:phosphotransferase family protein n=1 Tax=Bacillus sp. DJP31 TaxID=3409789 RepID=UPI003BB4CE73